jgi:hypothetical protein
MLAASIVIFAVAAVQSGEVNRRVAWLLQNAHAVTWPYPANQPGHPYRYVAQPDGKFILYDTSSDLSVVYLGASWVLGLLAGAYFAVSKHFRLATPLPLICCMVISAWWLINRNPNQLGLNDLQRAMIDPGARLIYGWVGSPPVSLCPGIVHIIESSAGKGGYQYGIFPSNDGQFDTDVINFSHPETANAFASLVAAKAKEANCPL